MYDPLPSPAQMALWDKTAIRELGIRPEVLMESACRESLFVLEKEIKTLAGRHALVVAGPGNNGGDALGLARLLADRDVRVLVLHTRPKRAYKGESRANLRLAQALGIELRLAARTDLAALPQPDMVIDGLLGTGFSGDLRPDALALIRQMNAWGERAFVLALDIPSGLNGFSGRPQPEAVRADATVTFQAAKLGLALPEAAAHAGRVHVRDIGIPRMVQRMHPPEHSLITADVLSLAPAPAPFMHKGTAGHVLVAGGSEGLAGAPALAARAALRAGAGLATLAAPGPVARHSAAGQPDIMTLPLGDDAGWSRKCATRLFKDLERFDAMALGPGLGRDAGAAAFVEAVASRAEPIPTVYDADALYHLAQAPELMAKLGPGAVLTPHPGEMARLAGLSTAEVQADRPGLARHFAMEHAVVLVLKGAGTIVATADGEARLCPLAAPNLAVGGSGDVLSGVIAALLARGLAPADAACLAVYWHARCGERLRQTHPMRGNLASEIADALPLVLKEEPLC